MADVIRAMGVVYVVEAGCALVWPADKRSLREHFEGVTATWKGGFAYIWRHHLLLHTGRSTATIVQSLQICFVKRDLSLAGPATTYSPVS